ncbi:phage baseplate protein [Erwinia sp. HR93]|uniref:phage baseplate protein n=1 Tax=Erwinia sp. HR93 TaxID=3094840 RepID=UPI002ADEB76E|nr:hypothetical protein [Erwinia sp. HR93]MEA1064301.1 hypothetical protein [Erwinia sp. HR93]
MDILSAIFTAYGHRIGTLVPTVVTVETHAHKLNVTSLPVERGASISDHAWVEPAAVTMKCGFAGGGSLLNFIDTTGWQIKSGLSPAETLDSLIALQKSAALIRVVTSKRTYENMLLTSIATSTTKGDEHNLTCDLELKEVVLVESQQKSAAPKTNMTQGVSTSALQNAGMKSVRPVQDSGKKMALRQGAV